MDRNGFTIWQKSQRLPPEMSKKVIVVHNFWKKKMKSALENNPHSNVIRNFWEKKTMKSAGCFRVNWVIQMGQPERPPPNLPFQLP